VGQKFRKDMEGSGHDRVLWYSTSILLEGLRETTKNLSQDHWSPGRDLRSGPPKYEYEPFSHSVRSHIQEGTYIVYTHMYVYL
jgi:hypothetical protein